MGWFARLFGGPTAPADIGQIIAAGVSVALPLADPPCAPGARIYHEYFMGDGPAPDGLFHWHARVYAANGEVIENRGAHPSETQAHAAAQGWAAMKKAELRGKQ
ncbi:MAG: hypothetical protein V4508_02275 [Pseudomonadota bacterium]